MKICLILLFLGAILSVTLAASIRTDPRDLMKRRITNGRPLWPMRIPKTEKKFYTFRLRKNKMGEEVYTVNANMPLSEVVQKMTINHRPFVPIKPVLF